ncbi:MAG: hypothetical protein ACOC22_01220 [bacterium]
MIIGVFLVILAFLAIFAFALFYSSLSWGFVLYKFWGWFLIPGFAYAFPEVVVNQITFPLAVGLFLFTSFFKNQEVQLIKKEYKDNTASAWGGILAPWITLGIAWVIMYFIM